MAAENTTNNSHLETLPSHLSGVILNKVGRDSLIDFFNTLSSCKKMKESADGEVYRNLNITPLVKKPLLSKNYTTVMEKCLANSNLVAHYVKGIICYFHENNTADGLHHFTVAADGGHQESIYLCGILMLCNNRFSEGKNYITKLNMFEDTEAADALWKKTRSSLNGIRVEKKHEYFASMANLEPGEECHITDLEITCEKLFYFKQVVKFVFM